ncbi:hypothetical protein HMPREF0629_01305 [Peptoniphilus sp. oral taxon 386 str. F0131]|nr:hypothetical protein HMPREF0629_01305 [Peptoniphilus sp. oral taxon 386 str. F0131]
MIVVMKIPLKILLRLKKSAERIYNDKDKFSELLEKIKHSRLNIDEFSKIKFELILLISMCYDFIKGRYKNIRKSDMLLIICAFIYLLNPMDIIPDMLLEIGFLDDLTILTYLISKIRLQIKNYEKWKMENEVK